MFTRYPYFVFLCVVASGCILFWEPPVRASENERYKAIPMVSGGYVFIIDTREGNIWTWNSMKSLSKIFSLLFTWRLQ